MHRFLFIGLALASLGLLKAADTKTDREKYIEQWQDVAVEQMIEHGIPASITMAQAILESGDGKSMLAQKANNHFGIKCHGWNGPGVYKDDDKKDECFRKYKNARQSFDDHSQFLLRPRYARLFELKLNDYKGWARGLKKAGYATDPNYAKRLISIIEAHKLDKLDKQDRPLANAKSETKSKEKKVRPRYRPSTRSQDIAGIEIDMTNTRVIQVHKNRIKYVVAKKGDKVQALAKDLEMAAWQIKRYNDLTGDRPFKAGELVFIQPKRNKGKTDSYIVKSGDSLRSISQAEGVKLSRLERYNKLTSGATLSPGQKILLRKPKP